MIFNNPIFTEMILPFLLIFVVIFAILQKSKILGDGKKQIDSLVALAIALLLIGVPDARNIVTGIIPWLAVGIVVLLMYFLLYGFIPEGEGSKGMPKWMRNMIYLVVILFVVVVLFTVTPLGGMIYDFVIAGTSSEVWINVIMIAVIVAVIGVAVKGGSWGKDD
ncbi:MAG: hypothetical protein IH845_02520 [Nanoarchaeota archaeon]|nr:hypothetical protein [Nanoarchaeota archaeon]